MLLLLRSARTGARRYDRVLLRGSSAFFHHRLAPAEGNCAGTGSAAGRDGPTVTVEREGEVPPLVRFDSAILRYPSPADCGLNDDHCDGIDVADTQAEKSQEEGSRFDRRGDQSSSRGFDLNIWPNLECGSGGGGHVVLGRNASGKTLLSRSLVQSLGGAADERDRASEEDGPFLRSGEMVVTRRRADENRSHRFLSHVSFDSHASLLRDPRAPTVHRALIPSGGNRLSPTAKFLSVRLGMFPLLPRRVDALSTGEARRVLLVRALVRRPELLVLDNAFDGLDVAGRTALRDIVERVLRGFRMDILVQGVGDAKDTARTQVLLFTHRPEEIADGMGKVTFVGDEDRWGNGGFTTEDRLGRSAEDLVMSLASHENVEETSSNDGPLLQPWDCVSNDCYPTMGEIEEFWEYGRQRVNDESVLVLAKNMTISRNGTTLLSRLNWTVQRGERWHLAGTNGAGKSTLSRMIFRVSRTKDLDFAKDDGGDLQKWKWNEVISGGDLAVASSNTRLKRGGISWVSTELHLHATNNWQERTSMEIMESGMLLPVAGDALFAGAARAMDLDIAIAAVRWLGLLDDNRHHISSCSSDHPFLSRRFSTLSQGEQKLLLVASAIAQRPSLLLLDEPCQGLDFWNRGRLLGLVERICRATDMSLLYVTHHEEELIPAVGHRLCLDGGKAAYCGVR